MSQNELVIEDKTHANNGRNDRKRVIITMCPPSKLTEENQPLRAGTQSNQKAEEQMESKEESGQEGESESKLSSIEKPTHHQQQPRASAGQIGFVELYLRK